MIREEESIKINALFDELSKASEVIVSRREYSCYEIMCALACVIGWYAAKSVLRCKEEKDAVNI
jgi:hypothetical protein